MSRTVDVRVTCLRTAVLEASDLFDPQRMMTVWRLDQSPKCEVITAESGRETDSHITRVDLAISRDLADTLESPWSIEALGAPIIHKLKARLKVNAVVFDYTVVG